mgnify:FL=1
MYLLNSSEVQKRISSSHRLREIARQTGRNPEKSTRALYRLLLTRAPTQQELATALAYPGMEAGQRQAFEDLAWALINSKEFLYRH